MPVDLAVGSGEIVGFYGIIGSGRSSFLKSIWGANPLARGSIVLAKKRIPPAGIAERVKAGAAYAPDPAREHRHTARDYR
jgi:ABC-type sugar transport system ATPase subunit